MPTDNTPLVSVVIPAYNHEAYVQQTIRSIIAQTYINIELLVLDDGSKDATLVKMQEIKEECQSRFVSVWFHTHANGGTCATLNALLQQATGKYVYLIASDDVAKPQAIQRLVDILEADAQCVLAVGDNEFIDSAGNRVFKNSKKEVVADESEATYKTFAGQFGYNNLAKYLGEQFGSYESLLQGNYIPNGYLMRRDSLDQVGGYCVDAPLEDYYMALQLSKLGTMRFINEILFSYRLHNTNTAANTEHMLSLTRKTLLYESQLVAFTPATCFYKLFHGYMSRRHYLFSIKSLFSLYRVRNRLVSELYVEIMGISIKLRGKKRY